ncbi:hypothetical protein P43SY_003151 [Pythium insidiosum]|uniref:Uncharacterized protein n=1 Tax=Pythium insidiosum TaxID=114742 RepID=A0AAD5Q5N9_PYTIN|nr:hypothetical protein P43SY_003151 [Pythium insidiosum]
MQGHLTATASSGNESNVDSAAESSDDEAADASDGDQESEASATKSKTTADRDDDASSSDNDVETNEHSESESGDYGAAASDSDSESEASATKSKSTADGNDAASPSASDNDGEANKSSAAESDSNDQATAPKNNPRDIDAILVWKKTGSRFKTLKDFLNSKQGKQHKPPKAHGAGDSWMACGYDAVGVALDLLRLPNPVSNQMIEDFRKRGAKRREIDASTIAENGVTWPELRQFMKSLGSIDISVVEQNIFKGQSEGVDALAQLHLQDGVYLVGSSSYALGQVSGPSPVSVFLRMGQSLGRLKDSAIERIIHPEAEHIINNYERRNTTMADMQLVILRGMPGSGKTTFAWFMELYARPIGLSVPGTIKNATVSAFVDSELDGFPVYTTEGFVLDVPENQNLLLARRVGTARVRGARPKRHDPDALHEAAVLHYSKHAHVSRHGPTKIMNKREVKNIADGEFCFFVSATSEKAARQLPSDWEAYENHPAEDLLKSFKDTVFVKQLASTLPTRSVDVQAEIELLGPTPVVRRQFRLSEEQKEAIRQWTQEMLSAAMIRPSTSAFSSPTFCIKKAVGWRIVHDFHTINARVRIPATPGPRKEDIYDAMSKGRIFSALDLLWSALPP